MTTFQGHYPSGSSYLTSTEKQIVLNKYLEEANSKRKYSDCLQKFISSQYPEKQVSLLYVNTLIARSKKRSHKETLLREITNARNSVTFKSQCQSCIDFSPTLQAAVNSCQLTNSHYLSFEETRKGRWFPTTL